MVVAVTVVVMVVETVVAVAVVETVVTVVMTVAVVMTVVMVVETVVAVTVVTVVMTVAVVMTVVMVVETVAVVMVVETVAVVMTVVMVVETVVVVTVAVTVDPEVWGGVRWSVVRPVLSSCCLELMDDGQWQSEGPVRRGGLGEAELHSEGSARSPDQNHNRLLEEGEEVEQGPRGGHRTTQDTTNNNHSTAEDEEDDDDEDEAYEEGSKVEEEDDEEEMDSNSGAFSPELDGQIQDSPSSSPSPTVSEAPLSVQCLAVGAAVPELGPSLSACVCVLEERGDDALL
ncbi:hypothetical protein NFI96_020897, partial [Prochilodus magdalenae]